MRPVPPMRPKQVPGGNVVQRGGGSGSSHSQSGTNQSTGSLIKDIMANGGVIRSVVNMKNTIMKISIHNRQQVGGREAWEGWEG
jgi:hypothetical protein